MTHRFILTIAMGVALLDSQRVVRGAAGADWTAAITSSAWVRQTAGRSGAIRTRLYVRDRKVIAAFELGS